MSTQIRKIIFFVLVIVAGFEIGHYSWNVIRIPFSNPLGLTGPLTLTQFNPLNNLVRYVFFVSAPSLLLLVLYYFNSKARSLTHAQSTEVSNGPASPFFFRIVMGFYSLWIVIEALRFMSLSLDNPLDAFHEGELLAPAWNYKLLEGIWTKSFFIHGALYDVFTPIMAWNLFGVESIGANRLFVAMLQFSVFPVVAFFFFYASSFAAKKCTPAWILLALGLLTMWNLSIDVVQILDRRDFVLLVGLIAFLASVKRKNMLLAALAGIAVPVSFFYTIDRGAYLLALILAGLMFLGSFSKERVSILRGIALPLIAGLLVGFFVLFVLVGGEEFSSFLSVTGYFYKAKDLFDSYLFQQPFVDLQNSKSRPLLLIGIQLFGLTYYSLRDYVSGKNLNAGLVQVLFVGGAVFYFRSALGRSDDYHFAYASTFTYLGIAYLVWLWCRALSSKTQPLAIGIVTVLALFGFSKRATGDNESFMFPHAPPNQVTWSSISTFPNRMSNLVNDPDEAFLKVGEGYLGDKYRKVVPWLREQFANEKCFFSFTNEPALSFLLKKPTCSRHYIVWFASATHLQKEILNDLEASAPGVILYRSPAPHFNMDDIDSLERLPLVNDHFIQNYIRHDNVDGWEVWKKKIL